MELNVIRFPLELALCLVVLGSRIGVQKRICPASLLGALFGHYEFPGCWMHLEWKFNDAEKLM